MNDTDDVLVSRFWFEQIDPKLWFEKSASFDQRVAMLFRDKVDQALAGQLNVWGTQARSALSLIVVLDQFTRNIYRDKPLAFAGDALALNLSLRALEQGWVHDEPEVTRRKFFLMPMMHSESLLIQQASLPLFKTLTDENTYTFAVKHCQIIERFGRFAHRNRILGRINTPDETAFLSQPGFSF